MKVTFVSNYINHHQIPLAEELYDVLGEDYRFIQTEEMEEERVRMGWDAHTESLPYLLKYNENPEEAKKRIEDSDVVVFGGTDDESYITKRLEAHKPVIRCSERLYKTGQWKAISPRGLRKKYLDHTRYRNQPVYLLCAGAYVPSDFHIVRAYPGKMFRWGYFPPFVSHDPNALMQQKKSNSVPRLLWSGRFLDWKHPLDALDLAVRLKREGLDFELVMIGGGEQETQIREQIAHQGLQDVVRLTGFLQPGEVREEMEQADIFLFTSDYQEGWGAVLNEAMNSGLAVVANVAAGASPYLIRHGQNGLLYKNKDRESLFTHVRYLLKQPDVREKIGRNAYETIAHTWNAKAASKALLLLCERILQENNTGLQEENAALPEKKGTALPHTKNITLPVQGPGSPAPVISQRGMYAAAMKRRTL